MSSALRIRLIGGLSVEVGARTVPDDAWRLRKGKALVKLVSLAPDRRLHRDRAMEALWPDRPRDAALNNLHQALHAARRALGAAGGDGAALLALRDELLSLAPAWIDLDEFEAAARRARERGTPDAYRAALALADGELLPEDAYEAWAMPRRAAYAELRLALLLELAGALDAAGDRGGAVEALQRAVGDSPLHEEAHRRLMRLFAAAGRRQDALAQYQALRTALDRELAAEPDPETRRLYRELLAGGEAAAGAPERNEGAAPAPADDGAAPASAAEGAAPEPTAAPTNLPAALTSFVGRDRERREVARALERGRLVTLTGPGGCGKTRLALEVAAGRPARDGTWLVELAALSDPAAVAEAVASALGLHTHAGRGPLATVAEHLAARESLIVLDNCEHLVDTCAEVAETLLRAAPALRILATSREPLRVAGEVAWRVPSLSLPDAHAEGGEAARSESVRLFRERARAAAPQADIDDPETAAAVAELCRRLDGMPLAIELAAARMAVLSPGQIAERLAHSLDVLGGGPRGANRRQTLRATLEWSHALLDDDERVLFRRLAVFAGTFDLEAVEQVCGGDGLDAASVVEVLGRLADKSLIVVAPVGGAYRYRLLEVVRQYAGELLRAAGEQAAVTARHRRHFLQVARRNVERPRRLEPEHANLGAAMGSALRADGAMAHSLASALCPYWMARGHFAEGGRWLDAVLALPDGPTEQRARLLIDACALDIRRGRPERLVALAEEGLALRRRLPGRSRAAQASAELALMRWVTSDLDAAEREAAEAIAAAEAAGDPAARAVATHMEAVLAFCRGRFAGASERFAEAVRRLDAVPRSAGAFFPAFTLGFCVGRDSPSGRPRCRFEETIVLFRRVDAPSAAAYALVNASFASRTVGDHGAAVDALGEALERFESAGDLAGATVALNLLGHAARQRGDLDAADRMLRRSLERRHELGELRAFALGISALGLLAVAAGDEGVARDRLAEAQAIFEATEDVPGLGVGALHLGQLELDLGDPERALEPIRRSIAVSRQQHILRSLGWAELTLAEAAAAAGDQEARETALAGAAAAFGQLGDAHGLAALRQEIA